MSRDTDTTQGATARDARHVPLSRADRLAQDAAEAARVRALVNDPDVVALRAETVRTQVDAALWVGIALGLAFTMVNVQQFAAAGAAAWSLPWVAAWLLDPMVSLVLVAVLRAEQLTARYQVATGRWADRTKWFAFAATYGMNTWQAWAQLDPPGIVLHSVPPVLVFCAAETAPWLRDRLTEAVLTAAGEAHTGTSNGPAPGSGRPHESANGAASASAGAPEPVGQLTAPIRAGRTSASQAGSTSGGRKLLGDYLAEARAAHTPDIEPTPAWVRQVTACGRGTSQKVADTLRTELDQSNRSQPSTEPAQEVAA